MTSSTSFDSDDDGSSSQHSPSSSSSPDSRQAPPHSSARMGTAGLLCTSPCFSSDSMAHGMAPAESPPSKRQRQHMQDSTQQPEAAPGIHHHQLDVSAGQQPILTLPSLHSMLGHGAATSNPRLASATTALLAGGAPAPPAPPQHSPWGGSSQQQHVVEADQGSPFMSCSSQGTGEEGPSCSPWSTSSLPPTHTMTNTATAAAAATARVASAPRGSLQLVQRFLHACGSQEAVSALAVLMHNGLLPVQPVLTQDGRGECNAACDMHAQVTPGAACGCLHFSAINSQTLPLVPTGGAFCIFVRTAGTVAEPARRCLSCRPQKPLAGPWRPPCPTCWCWPPGAMR